MRCLRYIVFAVIPLLISSFSTVFAQTPAISSVDATQAYTGQTITLQGSNLPTLGNAQVRFGDMEAPILEATTSEIKVEFPLDAKIGPVRVLDKSTNKQTAYVPPVVPSFGGSSNLDINRLSENFTAQYSGGTPFDVLAADFTGDGKTDYLMTNETLTLAYVWKNNSGPGTASFIRYSAYVGFTTRNAQAGDLDGDGKLDAILSGTGSNSDKIALLRNVNTANAVAFATPQLINLPNNGAARIEVYDLNNDGKPELILSNRAEGNVLIYINESTAGSIKFNGTPLKISVNGAVSTHGLAIADLDNDNKVDLALTTYQTNSVYLLKNTSSGSTISFSSPTVLATNTALINIIATDLTNDGNPDLVATSNFGNRLYLWQHGGGNSINYGSATEISTASLPWGISSGDLNGDGLPEVVVSHVGTTQLDILHNQSSSGSLNLNLLPFSSQKNGRNCTISDVDGNGRPDILYTGTVGYLQIVRNTHCAGPKAILETPANTVICAGQSIVLKANKLPGSTYTWYKDGAQISTGVDKFTYETTVSGSYTVKIANSTEGCNTSVSDAVTLTSYDTGNGSAVFTNLLPACEGETVKLQVTEVSGATYTWSGPNGFTATTTENFYNLENITANAAGTYSVTITVGPCQFSLSSNLLSVSPIPAPTISSDSPRLCSGVSATLTAPTGFISYQWLKDGSPYIGSGANSNIIVVSEPGKYTIQVKNSGGCTGSSAEFDLVRVADPIAQFAIPEKACKGSEITFTNKSNVAASESATYSWNFGDGTTSTSFEPTHSYTTAGTYTVELQVDYEGLPCPDYETATIVVEEAPTIEISASALQFCPGDISTLSVNGDIASVSWNTGDTGISLEVSQAGTYSANVTTSSGCVISKSIVVDYHTIPELIISVDKTDLGRGDTVQLAASSGVTFSWEPTTGLSDPTIANPLAFPQISTTYILTSTTADGCINVAEITLEVESDIALNAPKLFVPAVDEFWVIPNMELYPELRLRIFDSLGKTLFESKPYTNNWTGQGTSGDLPGGVYYYIVLNPENTIIKSGSITIVR